MSHYHFQPESHIFDSGKPGAHFVVTGRIHGDEPSGEEAEREVIRRLIRKEIELKAGRLILIPVSNPLAKYEDTRGIFGDPNRNITDRLVPLHEENVVGLTLATELRKLADQARSAGQSFHLLDLHSVKLPAEAHLVTSGSLDDDAAVRAIGLPKVYANWRRAYLNIEEPDLQALNTTATAFRDYTSAIIYWAQEVGARSAVCIESGQDNDPRGREIALNGILRSLDLHGLTEGVSIPAAVPDQRLTINLERVLIKRDDTEKLIGIEQEGQILTPGQVILKGATREVTVPHEPGTWIIAHAMQASKRGGHFGFLARRSEPVPAG